MDEHPAAPMVLAADIGATSMRAALVNARGDTMERIATPTQPERGFDDAADRLAALFMSVGEDAEPAAIGISTAGPVDPRTGIYSYPPNLPGWHGRSLLAALQPRFDLPMVLGHDATLAAKAEARFGAHAGSRDLIYLTVSTGIGAGIISGGQLLTGSSGGAGEAGHLIVAPGGPSCGAGCPGCLEAVASGTGIAAEAGRRIEAGATTTLPAHPTTAEVFAAAEEGDALAAPLIEEAIGHLGTGIANLLAVLDPEVIILGGGMTVSLARRWNEVMEAARSRALPRYQSHLPLELTTLGDDPCLLGAAVIAFEHLDANVYAT